MRHLVALLAHGSPDQRSAAAARELATRVAGELPEADVRCAFLDNDEPSLEQLVRGAQPNGVTVVPLFLNDAFHARVDVPAAVAAAREHCDAITVTDSLAHQPSLIAWLDGRLPTGVPVVMATAGTRDESAQAQLRKLAAAWASTRGTDVRVAYASMAEPTVGQALEELGPSAAVAAYLLFPGTLVDRIEAEASGRAITPPLAGSAALVEVIAALAAGARPAQP